MDLCTFLEKFFSGDPEVLQRMPDIVTLAIAPKVPGGSMIAHMLTQYLRSILDSGDELRRVAAAILVAHVYAYVIPLRIVRDLVDKAYAILRQAYERCDDPNIAVILAEASVHKALLEAHPRRYGITEGLFRDAVKLVKSVKDESDPKYWRSLGIIYLRRSEVALRFGLLDRSITLAKRAQACFERSDEKQVDKLVYDRLVRATYLKGHEDVSERLAEEFVRSLDGLNKAAAMVYIHTLSLDFLFTDFDFLADKIDELKDELGIPEVTLNRNPIYALAKTYRGLLDAGWEETLKSLSRFLRIPDSFLNALTRVLIAKLDTNTERIINELSRAVDKAIVSGSLDVGRLAVRVGIKKGVPKNEVEKRKRKLHEQIQTRRTQAQSLGEDQTEQGGRGVFTLQGGGDRNDPPEDPE